MKSILLVALFFSGFSTAAIRPFSLLWMNHPTPNTMYKSVDYPNSIFVIESFFNSCPPCNLNAPQVELLAEQYEHEPRVRFLDIGIDRKKSDYQSWISKHHPNHPVLMDGDTLLNLQLGTQAYPSSYVVDCKGNVVAQTLGTWDDKAIATLRFAINDQLTHDCE